MPPADVYIVRDARHGGRVVAFDACLHSDALIETRPTLRMVIYVLDVFPQDRTPQREACAAMVIARLQSLAGTRWTPTSASLADMNINNTREISLISMR